MTWRLKQSQYEKQKGLGNKRSLKKLVSRKMPIGILAFINDQPIGWCSLAPREHFVRLENSRILKRVDDTPVWSIVCFFISKTSRNKGLSVKLIKSAIEYARVNGAKTIEAYPVEPKKIPMPEVFAFTGLASAFRKAGFKEVARNSATRPIVRYTITA